MKKVIYVLALTCLVLGGCKATTATQACSDDYKTQSDTAKSYIQAILDGAFETAATYAHDEVMTKTISDQKYIESIKPNLETLGTLKEIGAPLCESKGDKMTVSLPIKFSIQNVNINVTFDKDGNISDVTFSQYSGK